MTEKDRKGLPKKTKRTAEKDEKDYRKGRKGPPKRRKGRKGLPKRTKRAANIKFSCYQAIIYNNKIIYSNKPDVQ